MRCDGRAPRGHPGPAAIRPAAARSLDGPEAPHYLRSMRLAVALALIWLVGTRGAAMASAHHYTRAERYAGCMFGETVPLMRRGAERERALSIASDRCLVWAQGLSSGDIRDVNAELRRALERFERRGL